MLYRIPFIGVFLFLASVSGASVGSEALEGSQAQISSIPANVDTWDGFISYRRSASRHLAMLIKVMLEGRNVSGYLDVEDLEGGDWDSQLMESIQLAPNFILVLSNGTLERCKGDFNYTDFLHRVSNNTEIRQELTFIYDLNY